MHFAYKILHKNCIYKIYTKFILNNIKIFTNLSMNGKLEAPKSLYWSTAIFACTLIIVLFDPNSHQTMLASLNLL